LEAAQTGETLPMDERIKMRFDASRVAVKCADAVNAMFIACGAQGIHRGHPLNRAWLDINAGRTHVANNPFKFGRNMGGDLSGGKVCGNSVVCPFHLWSWGSDGVCDDIPYAKKIPDKAVIKSWPVLERNGLVMVWQDSENNAPRANSALPTGRETLPRCG
jgi:hypothetical protein